MIRSRLYPFIFFIVAQAFAWASFAQTTFTVPKLTGPVVDEAGFLSPSGRQQIENYLSRLKEAGGSQIQVLILPDLGGLEIEDASIRVTDAWKIGGKKEDNGVLLLIALAEKRLRIEVGQGLEGAVPDVYAKRIVEDVIVPHMRAGERDLAVFAGIQTIASLTDPDKVSAPAKGKRSRRGQGKET